MLLLYIQIFLSRIVDVSISTIRTMYVIRGEKIVSTILAFIEVLIWFFAARAALTYEGNNYLIAIFYSLGYASGSLIGSFLYDLFIDGVYNVQIISDLINMNDILKIRQNNFGLSVLRTIDNKYLIMVSLKKNRYKEFIRLIKSIDSSSFIVVSEAKIAFNGYLKNKKNTN